jgi:hypothetical protein
MLLWPFTDAAIKALAPSASVMFGSACDSSRSRTISACPPNARLSALFSVRFALRSRKRLHSARREQSRCDRLGRHEQRGHTITRLRVYRRSRRQQHPNGVSLAGLCSTHEDCGAVTEGALTSAPSFNAFHHGEVVCWKSPLSTNVPVPAISKLQAHSLYFYFRCGRFCGREQLEQANSLPVFTIGLI